jgi:hypothetical protein
MKHLENTMHSSRAFLPAKKSASNLGIINVDIVGP